MLIQGVLHKQRGPECKLGKVSGFRKAIRLGHILNTILYQNIVYITTTTTSISSVSERRLQLSLKILSSQHRNICSLCCSRFIFTNNKEPDSCQMPIHN